MKSGLVESRVATFADSAGSINPESFDGWSKSPLTHWARRARASWTRKAFGAHE